MNYKYNCLVFLSLTSTLLFWRSNRSLLNVADLRTVDSLEYRWPYSKVFYCPEICPRFPDVLVVGVKKCGTGAIIEQLGIHPQVSSPFYTIQVGAPGERRGETIEEFYI